MKNEELFEVVFNDLLSNNTRFIAIKGAKLIEVEEINIKDKIEIFFLCLIKLIIILLINIREKILWRYFK